MRTALAACAAVILFAGPALAQTEKSRDARQPEATAPTSMADMAKMTPDELHKHCTMMLGSQMQGAPKHDYSAEKKGSAPARKAPSEAEMKAMHDKCVAVMAAKPAPAKP